MAKQSISLGSSANDGTGSTLRAGGDLINDNFNEIYTLIGDGTDLSLSGLTLPSATLSGNATITSIVSSSAFTIDAANNINLDSDTGQVIIKDGGTTIASLLNSSTDFIIESATSDKDIIFKVNDGGSSTEVMRIDGDVPAVLLPQNVEMRFTDSQESIKSDGSNLILKSGNQAYTIPATDGSADQFLKTNGSGVLSFATVNTTTAFDDVTAGDAAVNVTTTAGNITIDAQGSDTDIIFKGTDGSSDITPMTIDMSDAGAILLTGGKIDLQNAGSQSVINFYCESSNAHYAALQAPAHSDFSGNITLTLPATTDTLVGKATIDTLTNKRLTTPKINEDVDVSATSTEINVLDGITASTAELNKLDGVTATTSEINKLASAGTLLQAGKQTIWVPATAMTPTASNGCANLATVETTAGRPDMNVLDFDKDSDEFAQFSVAFPKSWNAGTVTFQFYWSGNASTDGVAMSLQGVAFADNDSIDTAYGTAVVVQDDAQGAVEELLVSAESSAITIAGSPGDNELVYFRIGRDVSDSNDDMAADCRLHGVKLFFTTDAANDA